MSSDSYVINKSSLFGQKKERIDIYVLNLLNKNCFHVELDSNFTSYSIVKVSCQGFYYYLIIWKKTSFITENFHIINNFKEDNKTLVCDSNLENTVVNEKFDEFAKNRTSLNFWTNNENTIIDFLKVKFYIYYIKSKNVTCDKQDSLEFVRFMKTKFRDITFIDNYYKMWLDVKNNKN